VLAASPPAIKLTAEAERLPNILIQT
jgi:hypothetical protein